MDLERLFDAVYESPSDDVRKQVLADALQAGGDPRGDFIAFQLRDSAITRRRADKLLLRHREAFLMALWNEVVNPTDPQRLDTIDERWSKGFLVECTARPSGLTSDLREWATVQVLHLIEGPMSLGEPASSHFRSLKTVRLYGSDGFARRAKALFSKVPHEAVRLTHVAR